MIKINPVCTRTLQEKDKGENVAFYVRKALNKVEHLKDVKYKYDFNKSKIYVLDKPSDRLIKVFALQR